LRADFGTGTMDRSRQQRTVVTSKSKRDLRTAFAASAAREVMIKADHGSIAISPKRLNGSASP